MQQIFSMLAGGLYIAGYAPYIRSILQGHTKPSKASWIIWSLIDFLTIAGMIAKGTVNGQIIGAVIGSWCIALLSLRYGLAGWKTLDIVCLIGGLIGIALWQYFQEATYGIVIGQLTMLIGCMPTFVSAFHHPSYENRLAWTIYFLSCIPAILAVQKWTLADATQPIAFLISETGMMVFLWVVPFIRKRRKIAAFPE